MCIYGYFQELVIYGWFERKYSMFTTFLHFIGCFCLSHLQRKLSSSSTTSSYNHHHHNHIYSSYSSGGSGSNNSGNSSHISNGGYVINGSINPLDHHHNDVIASKISSSKGTAASSSSSSIAASSTYNYGMGNASLHVSIKLYLFLIGIRMMGQGMSNLSMSQINYPAKVLFKSANPVITLLIGVLYEEKRYPMSDYLVVLLLIVGLYIFVSCGNDGNETSSSTTPQSTRLGIFYVLLSMLGSAGVPIVQQYCMEKYSAAQEDLLYYCFLGSAVMSFIVSVVSGDFIPGVIFMINTSSLRTWLLLITFIVFSYGGANFSIALTKEQGALFNGILNTFRKGLTIALSFVMFPERNILSTQKLIGALILFTGLCIQVLSTENKSASSYGLEHFMSCIGFRLSKKGSSDDIINSSTYPTVPRVLSFPRDGVPSYERVIDIPSSQIHGSYCQQHIV